MEKTIFTNRWYALRPSKLLKKEPIEVPVLGNNLVMWRNNEKRVIVQGNICPHRGAKLSMGDICDKRTCIQCPYHGWKFDDNGILKELPADNENNLVNKLGIQTYEAIENGGLIWFCPGNSTGTSPPVIHQMANKDWVSVTGYDIFHNDWLTTLENSIDITHVNFVHSDFGDKNNGQVTVDKIHEKKQDHLRMFSTINHKSDNPFLWFTEQSKLSVKHDILLPNTVSIQFWVKYILDVITYVTYTPLNNDTTLINWVFLRSPRVHFIDSILDCFFIDGMKKAILEDKLIVDNITPVQNRLNIHADSIQVKFRSTLNDMKLTEPSSEHGI